MSDFDNWAPSSSPLFNVVTRSKCPWSVFCNIEKGERGWWLSTKKMLLKLRKNVDRKRLFCSNVSTLLSMIVGRPAFPLNMVVPSFISTLKFANPLMPLPFQARALLKFPEQCILQCRHAPGGGGGVLDPSLGIGVPPRV